ncbi:MAG: asparagine synthase (glutamine-hydrolyzing) [Halioglobus sp.]
MCGITGILSSGAASSAGELVLEMARALRHRGPDDEGVWADASRGIALGHRRLSILDLSPAGHQPMVSAGGRYVLVYNGEIYNHLDLRQQLAAVGGVQPSWRGHSDTETLLAAIEAWGLARALSAAKGMFALALWDRQRDVLLLARDRMGEKPLYYGWQGGAFLFGSELKALRTHPAFAAEIDRGALALFLRHNCIPAPYSIYRGIHKLPAGCWLEVSLAQPATEPVPYWQLAAVAARGVAQPFGGGDADALTALETVMSAAVRSQMLADVPLGALLSGGIDSSLICALMQAHSATPIKTFTIGFAEKELNEADHARAVAQHLGTEHTELILHARDALALIPALPTVWDEPFADSSQLPTCLVMQLAHRQVAVALSGDGGDELFCGYNRYAHVPRLVRRLGWMPTRLRRLAGALLTSIPAPALNSGLHSLGARCGVTAAGDKAHKLGQKLRTVDFSTVAGVYQSLLTEWPDAAALVIDGYIPTNLLDDRDRHPALANPVAGMMALDSLVYLPDDILVKIDRAAMAVSLETRAPFLDRDLLEFGWRLPLHFKQRHGQGKWLLRRLLERHVPPALTDRPKAGFAIPLDAWLRGALRDWAEALLAEDRLQREGFFHADPIRAAWDKHCSGRENHGARLWSVLMFQSWLEANT